MSSKARRVWIIEEGFNPETGESTGCYDRQQAAELLVDLEGTLARVGGMVNLTVQRVQVGEAMGEPLAESVALIATWDSFTPLERPDAPAPADADHELVAEDAADAEWTPAGEGDDLRPASEIAAEFGDEPVAEPR